MQAISLSRNIHRSGTFSLLNSAAQGQSCTFTALLIAIPRFASLLPPRPEPPVAIGRHGGRGDVEVLSKELHTLEGFKKGSWVRKDCTTTKTKSSSLGKERRARYGGPPRWSVSCFQGFCPGPLRQHGMGGDMGGLQSSFGASSHVSLLGIRVLPLLVPAVGT